MVKITDKLLKTEIAKVMKDADLRKVSAKQIRKQLEKTLDTDLTEHKAKIDTIIMEHVNAQDSEESEESEKSEEEAVVVEEPPKKKKKGGGGGYTRAYKLSPALADLMGAESMARHEVVKRVWAIIKERNLYDQNNRLFTICDDQLYKVFGTKRFRTFGMMKYLKTHFHD